MRFARPSSRRTPIPSREISRGRTGALLALVVAGWTAPGGVRAQAAAAAPTTPPEVTVTANPLGDESTQLVQPASVLSGRGLDFRRAPTLGETLANEPGISQSWFGPNASRPVIRGLDADRIRLLQNGVGVIDASTMSFDHATAIEPLAVERIEVLRGPAALFFGANAIGGVVNALDNRIPREPIEGVGGRAEARHSTVDRGRAAVGLVEAGNGRFAIHADGFARESEDLRIPGLARSARQRAIDATLDPARSQPSGLLPNTFSRAAGGALGASLTGERGYFGAALGSLRSAYGTPADVDARIDLRRDTLDLGGEARELPGIFRSVRLRANRTDYAHDESDLRTRAIETTFRNRGFEARLEANHAPIGPLRGAIGLQASQLDFSALGARPFAPVTRSTARALFAYEELSLGPAVKLTAGARLERTARDSRGDASAAGLAQFGPPVAREFTTRSWSVGALWSATPALSLAATVAGIERPPTVHELFVNGAHAAAGTFEVGDPAFGPERSSAVDLSLRWRGARDSVTVGVYRNRFANYIVLAPTGRLRNDAGEVGDPATPGLAPSGAATDLPELAYRRVPAVVQGFEAQASRRLTLAERGTLELQVRADAVRATDLDSGRPLPRIPPLRLGLGAAWQWERWLVRGELLHVRGQFRTAPNELPTDGYTFLDAFASWRVSPGARSLEAFVRGTNLLNVEARVHASPIKDIAPLPGRGFLLGLRGTL